MGEGIIYPGVKDMILRLRATSSRPGRTSGAAVIAHAFGSLEV